MTCRSLGGTGVSQLSVARPLGTYFVLLTYVELGRFRGTCYKAANWKRVGITAGMGRNSKTGTVGEIPLKDIYVYPLHRRFREKLCGRESP